MPAERHQRPKRHSSGGGERASSSTSGHAHKKPKPLPLEKRSADGIPGLSKLKGSIRQTKRLLAKDNLEPSLRVQTQRRLAALEADLATAQKRDVERKNGAKYHAVKFFERQKLTRVIKRAQRALGADKPLKGKKLAKAEAELADARVMLNYVLHFPNTQKYISLFPSDGKEKASEDPDADDSGFKLPPLLSQEADGLDESARRRREMLLETRRLMADGKLPATPEVEGAGARTAVDIAPRAAAAKGAEEEAAAASEADDFFEGSD
ncbi:18S rRNA maturation protein [Vanrija albida]|uniref:rRNA-processing protein EFG1 n=1 Tax=Vanrija albida TaxID=181172 RepID=A0ABR3QEU5_9TREE